MMKLFVAAAAAVMIPCAGWAQLLDGPGKEETAKRCVGCHEVERSVSLRQDRAGWDSTVTKMVAFGMKLTPEERTAILDYLAAKYPAGEVPPLNVNKATAIELESRLSLKRSQAAAVISWRKENGNFKSIQDLKKVPNIDAEKIEARKDRIVF
jgi:competence protein ComEA